VNNCLCCERVHSLSQIDLASFAQPPIAAKWFGRVFRSCVRWCGGSCVVCVVRVTCVLLINVEEFKLCEQLSML